VRVNAQYNIASPHSIPIKIAGFQRRRMYDAFLAASAIGGADTVLDLGVTSDQTYDHSNYFVHWYPYKNRITAAGIDDASFLEQQHPGVKFVFGDGRSLPFADQQFDFVHSSAVLEHVGSKTMQAAFLTEAWRVARKGLFLTTPNRWFPIEFHTLLPIAHWLPQPAFRKICDLTGRSFFGCEENLNLLARSDLQRLARAAGLENVDITSVSLAGWPSNLLLCARREPCRDAGMEAHERHTSSVSPHDSLDRAVDDDCCARKL
jgi:hypothetical protein